MSSASRHGLKCIKARASGHDYVPTTTPLSHIMAGPSLSQAATGGGSRLVARSSGNDLTSMIAGSILGVLCFVAITFLIVRLLLRRRQRMYGDVKSVCSNGKLSRMSRNSTATLTSWYPRHQSTTSFRTGASTPSQFRGLHSHSYKYSNTSSQGGAGAPGHTRNISEPLSTPKPTLFFNNPFSKSAELCAAPPVDRRDPSVPGDLYIDPEATASLQSPPMRHAKQPSISNDLQTIQENVEEYPTKPERLFIPRSLYSNDRSIGSTIILPGRNSSVGSLQVLSYRMSNPFRFSSASRMQSPGVLLTPHMPVDNRRRSSTRSDPFDLEDGNPLHEHPPLPEYPLPEYQPLPPQHHQSQRL